MGDLVLSDLNLSFGSRLRSVFRPRTLERELSLLISRELTDFATRGVFEASDTTRFNAEWTTPMSFDINLVLSQELPKIRARQRWLALNNSTVSSAINSWVNYAVGVGHDLQMEVAVKRQEDGEVVIEELDRFNLYTEDLFKEWSDDVMASAPESAPESFYDAQEMAVIRWMTDGEVFIHMLPHRTKILQLEFVEPEALDTLKSRHGNNPVILGIELDHKTFRPVAYWVMSRSPENTGYLWAGNSVRIPVENMIHVFIRKFPRQLRGIPWFTAVQERIFQEGQYTKAMLLRNKIAAFFGVLFKGGKGVGKTMLKTSLGGGNGGGGGNQAWPVDSSGNPLTALAPAMMGSLPDGVEPYIINPASPESTYKDFVKLLETKSGAGMDFGMSFQLLTRNMDGLSFAGGRLAAQMDVQGIRRFQRAMSRKLCTPIFRKWMDYAVLSGAIKASSYSFNPKFWQKHEWLPGGWMFSVNPVQEVTAAKMSMDANITSLQDECSKLGLDWKQQLRKAAKVKKYREQLGLSADEEAGLPLAVNPDAENEEETEGIGQWLK